MRSHRFSGHRVVLSTVVAAGLLATFAGPAAADTTPPGDVTYSQSGSAAEAYAFTCTSNGDGTTSCTDQQLYVFSGKMTDSASSVTHASQACVYLSSFTYSDETGDFVGTPSWEQGCRVDLPAGAIRIDGKLSSAVLAPTTIHVEDLGCEKFECEPGPGRDVVASAAWAGYGPLSSSKSRGSSSDGTCRSHEAFKGSSRTADVTGSIDGQPFAGDVFGLLSSGKYSFKSSCREV